MAEKQARGMPAQAHTITEASVEPTQEQTTTAAMLLARIESLEARVLELESRKKYMKEYMKARRAEEK